MSSRRHSAFPLIVSAALFLLWVPQASAQTSGQAQISLEGYYFAGSGQRFSNTSGMSGTFSNFLPGIGLLKGSLQGYAYNGGLQGGDNFIALQGVSFLGHHWDLLGGNFRTAANLVQSPFLNIYNPEIAARGFQMEVSRTGQRVSFFIGRETLQEGPRIPFRVGAPQSVIGASLEQTIGERFQIGVRYLHLSSNDADIANQPNYFPVNRAFRSADILTFQSNYKLGKNLKLWGEAALSHAVRAEKETGIRTVPLSLFFGPAWETKRFSLRANYARESTTYLPILGYYAGDRKGPFAEGLFRLSKRIEFYGSASHYQNNLERDARVPTFASTDYSTGAYLSLPWKFSASGQISIVRLHSQSSEPAVVQNSNNRQASMDIGRQLGRHSLRFAFMDLKSVSNQGGQRQKSFEFGDDFTWKRLMLGGGLRLQSQGEPQSKNTLFFRGNTQVNLGRVSAYGYFERGNDFVNQTVFAKNAFTSTVFGLSAPLGRQWTLQFEAFRNNLTTNLNPESIFLLGNQGVALPSVLSGFNQWSVYFRISRPFRWGLPIQGGAGGLEGYAASKLPLVGTVEGIVVELSQGGGQPAVGIPVSLDDYKVVYTDATGHYRFTDVAEGAHNIALAQRELPAEFEPGLPAAAKVQVEPRHSARSEDLHVVRLTMLSGKIITPEGISPENVVVRLLPTDHYTTPDPDGSFTFYNLREGEYTLAVDAQSLPENCYLATPAQQPVTLRIGTEAPMMKFEIKERKVEKPVIKVSERRLILDRVNDRKEPM